MRAVCAGAISKVADAKLEGTKAVCAFSLPQHSKNLKQAEFKGRDIHAGAEKMPWETYAMFFYIDGNEFIIKK
ncbi:MAG TPA: hypothetical protein VJZ68_02755 [Nitrososphaera sp.]|nr:hypothetical protein [Nitrososphaera sp.]